MCGFCAVFAGSPHWSELPALELPDEHRRRLLRVQRLRLVNALIGAHGCTLEDWHGGQYILRSQRGRSEILESLPAVWAMVEAISGQALDPLSPALIARLRGTFGP